MNSLVFEAGTNKRSALSWNTVSPLAIGFYTEQAVAAACMPQKARFAAGDASRALSILARRVCAGEIGRTTKNNQIHRMETRIILQM